jgi:hypothetical protein
MFASSSSGTKAVNWLRPVAAFWAQPTKPIAAQRPRPAAKRPARRQEFSIMLRFLRAIRPDDQDSETTWTELCPRQLCNRSGDDFPRHGGCGNLFLGHPRFREMTLLRQRLFHRAKSKATWTLRRPLADRRCAIDAAAPHMPVHAVRLEIWETDAKGRFQAVGNDRQGATTSLRILRRLHKPYRGPTPTNLLDPGCAKIGHEGRSTSALGQKIIPRTNRGSEPSAANLVESAIALSVKVASDSGS